MTFELILLAVHLNIRGQSIELIIRVTNIVLSCLDCLINVCLCCLLVNVLPTLNKLIFSLNYSCDLCIDIELSN